MLIATLLLVVLPGGVLGLMSTLAGSEPARIALACAAKHPAVGARLRTPFKIGRLAPGIAVSGDSGSAEIEVPIYSANGNGTAEVPATKAAGRWNRAPPRHSTSGRQRRDHSHWRRVPDLI